MPSFITKIVALAICCHAAAALPVSSFNGTGELRTLWNQGNHTDLGCLTAAGLWTSDNTKCGVFEADRASDDSSLFNLTSAAGACQIIGARFSCDKANTPYEFGTWPENWPNGIPGVRVLRWGQYGLMASSGKNPPDPADTPEEIHLVSSSELGKYVWLVWAPVSG